MKWSIFSRFAGCVRCADWGKPRGGRWGSGVYKRLNCITVLFGDCDRCCLCAHRAPEKCWNARLFTQVSLRQVWLWLGARFDALTVNDMEYPLAWLLKVWKLLLVLFWTLEIVAFQRWRNISLLRATNVLQFLKKKVPTSFAAFKTPLHVGNAAYVATSFQPLVHFHCISRTTHMLPCIGMVRDVKRSSFKKIKRWKEMYSLLARDASLCMRCVGHA